MTKKLYGRIYFDPQDRGAWVISKAEPHVSIRLKQNFPSIPKQGVCPFYLRNDPIMAEDLRWFLSRYPMEISPDDEKILHNSADVFLQKQAEIGRILTPDYVPLPVSGIKEGFSLRPYQQQEIALARSVRNLLIGDEGGLGKTYTAGGFLCAEPGALPAAVVCETHMPSQWINKLNAFTNLRTHVIKGTTPYDLPVADVYLFKYSQLAGWVDFFDTGFFLGVVYDEIQNLRTGTASAKGGGALVLSKHAAFRIGLTATPIYNYGGEVWNVLQFIDPLALGSLQDFNLTWAHDGKHVDDPKALGAYLRERHVFIRHVKSDVGLQLPAVSRIIENIDYDEDAVSSVEKFAKTLAINAISGESAIRGNAARQLNILVRQATGVAKAKAVAAFTKIMLENEEPVILVGWHREVYDIWLNLLAEFNPAMYTGSETPAQKNKELNRFLNGDTNLLILSLRSGAGIDGLQHRCSTVIFGELDWSSKIHQQVIWRVDRDGQTNPVSAFFLVSNEGSDPPMMDILGIKANEAEKIVDPYKDSSSLETDNQGGKTYLNLLIQRYILKCSNAELPPDLRDIKKQKGANIDYVGNCEAGAANLPEEGSDLHQAEVTM